MATAQTYEKFQHLSGKELDRLRPLLPAAYYPQFLSLIAHRDTVYLKKRLSEMPATRIYLVEGYDFSTKEYSLFEAYKTDTVPAANIYPAYLDQRPEKRLAIGYFLRLDDQQLLHDSAAVDTIYPRKYRFGAGCVIDETVLKTFSKLEARAKKDGVVTEKYCRIETYIDKAENKMLIRYCFPVSGQREFDNRGAGMLTDYPPGLDFWLFASPYIVEKVK